MESLGNNVRLELFASSDLFNPKIRTLAEGEYFLQLNIAGNAIFSSLRVESMDPNTFIDARWYHFGSGSMPEEAVFKARHALITNDDLDQYGKTTDEVLVTRIHNKPFIVIKVIGGSVKIGLYCTTNSAFATDTDSALKLDGQPANLELDKFTPIAGLDRDTNQYQAAEIKNGAIYVVSSPSVDIEGERLILPDSVLTVPGEDAIILRQSVPIGKKWDLVKVDVITRATGRWVITAGDEFIGAGRSGTGLERSSFDWPYAHRMTEGEELEIVFEQPAGRPINTLDVFAHIIQSDI